MLCRGELLATDLSMRFHSLHRDYRSRHSAFGLASSFLKRQNKYHLLASYDTYAKKGTVRFMCAMASGAHRLHKISAISAV